MTAFRRQDLIEMSGSDPARLSRAIQAYFSGGLFIGTRTAQQIDSTFGYLSAQELKARLADATDCENSTLVHLVFSPDRATQIHLEPVLGPTAWLPGEITALQQALIARNLRTILHFADSRGNVHAPVPSGGIAVFIAGLHLDRFIPDSVADAIDGHLPGGIRMSVRVVLRNARIAWHPPVVDFLRRLFQGASRLQPDLQACVAIAAALAATAGEGGDLFRDLEALKTAHARRLRQAEVSEAALKRGNTEALMLGGNRLFQIDRREALQRMACIDAVALAAFDRLPAGPGAPQTLELNGCHDTLRRIDRLFR